MRYSHKVDRNSMQRAVHIIIGIVINVVLNFITYRSGLPIYIDTIGTFGMTIIGGIYPGIVTAVATNVACSMFNHDAIYFSFVHAFIAIFAAWFIRKYTLKHPGKIAFFVVGAGIFSGAVSSFVQWFVLGGPRDASVADLIRLLHALPSFPVFLLVNTVLNIFDKGLCLMAAILALKFMPEEKKKAIRDSAWKQNPLPESELERIRGRDKGVKHSVQSRSSFTLVGISLLLVIIMGSICVRLYFDNLKKERTLSAVHAAEFAAEVVDGDRIGEFIRNGYDTLGYNETRDLLYNIRNSATGVQYLYVIRIEPDGCRFVFDLETEDVEAYLPGEMTGFEEAFEPYLPALFEGEKIEPIESDDISGWVVTAYCPIRDRNGRTTAYAGADVSLDYTAYNMRIFAAKVVLIMAGFFMLVLSYGLWSTNVYTVFPIGSITSCIVRFAKSGDSQERLDENVKRIRSLDIHTNDEVEMLYKALCELTLNQAEQMRAIRHYTETTAKMQDGLIITMADMVENRDSDTGAHIQKTAAYVKIIVEGLKKKGYYIEKITPKFMSDVVRSAPLHDVGKINIPDEVLNKPGKLTDEEYAIMKTHAIAGKRIMENAISTIHGENYLKEARNMAAYHHERWDGKGYPEGLHGEVIPLSARIMAVADVFDALSSPRVYKPAFPLEKALSIIQEGSGTQFDPKCVEVFMDNLTEVKVILKKYNQDA